MNEERANANLRKMKYHFLFELVSDRWAWLSLWMNQHPDKITVAHIRTWKSLSRIRDQRARMKDSAFRKNTK